MGRAAFLKPVTSQDEGGAQILCGLPVDQEQKPIHGADVKRKRKSFPTTYKNKKFACVRQICCSCTEGLNRSPC